MPRIRVGRPSMPHDVMSERAAKPSLYSVAHRSWTPQYFAMKVLRQLPGRTRSGFYFSHGWKRYLEGVEHLSRMVLTLLLRDPDKLCVS